MEDESLPRLDNLIALNHKEITRSQANKLISSGRVKVDNKLNTKPSSHVNPKSIITLDIPNNNHDTKLVIPIIYEDKAVVVINKPVGILSHSKGSFNEETTVADWLAMHLGIDPSTNREGIVHRLDRATSGVMILAKTPEAQKWLTKQFSTRKAKKTYITIVSGHLSQPNAMIDMPIERNPKKPQLFRTGSNGKPAQTEYKVINENNGLSILELSPKTGRTHQLRVHLAGISHPILGDTFYGGKKADRLYLHAKILELTLPNGKTETFTAPLPKEFNSK